MPKDHWNTDADHTAMNKRFNEELKKELMSYQLTGQSQTLTRLSGSCHYTCEYDSETSLWHWCIKQADGSEYRSPNGYVTEVACSMIAEQHGHKKKQGAAGQSMEMNYKPPSFEPKI